MHADMSEQMCSLFQLWVSHDCLYIYMTDPSVCKTEQAASSGTHKIMLISTLMLKYIIIID